MAGAPIQTPAQASPDTSAKWLDLSDLSAPSAPSACIRPQPGAAVPEPVDLRSTRGVLEVALTLRNFRDANGSVRYCYMLPDGTQSPTLRLHPGDLLLLQLTNELNRSGDVMQPMPHDAHAVAHASALAAAHSAARAAHATDPCRSGEMSMLVTNLHFHGMALAPVCHQDEVLETAIASHATPFEYRIRIPVDAPPGLFWYHPHIHGFSKAQVLGGASGAIIIEGLERAEPAVAGLAERVLVIRDQDLVNPDAPPAASEPVVPRMLIDRDGDSANNGTGFGRPAKDLSVNFVPVPYPDYPPAVLRMQPAQQQLWRVLNASAITYLNLAVLYRRAAQQLGIVALDGVPMHHADGTTDAVQWVDHIGLPPGARAEFIITPPPPDVQGLLVTRSVDTGQGGENDPNRALATISAAMETPAPNSRLPSFEQALPAPSRPWLGDVAPVRVRKLYFSEKLSDPADPNSATEFYITQEGDTPAAFDPRAKAPNISVRQGDVEDWIIENRSTELHAFHIHQLHFLLMDWSDRPVAEPFLRDTVNVPYYNARMLHYPSVRLRMDFRDPNIVGTFVYHCHLLEHEDGGMMGTIRVEAAAGGS